MDNWIHFFQSMDCLYTTEGPLKPGPRFFIILSHARAQSDCAINTRKSGPLQIFSPLFAYLSRGASRKHPRQESESMNARLRKYFCLMMLAAMSGLAVGQNGKLSPASSNVTTNGGTPTSIPFFSTSTDIENSILTQSGANQIDVAGSLEASGSVAGNSFRIGSQLFAFGSNANYDAFLGFAGNKTMTGQGNTGIG